ncbi:FRG domain-containing protein [Peribacillus butanolivorans]|uniref:FRG domain-containing protein n=1 Tax=Peribacillus butanolivorans TaxID=421767 RepID=UPI0035DB65BB
MFSETWNKVMSEVLEFQNAGKDTWYRGQNNAEYKLVSGLYRKKFEDINTYAASEITYYQLFNRMGFTYHKENDWNLLFIMQHYGVRTRLLDWTESFAVALYFAYTNWDFKTHCSVWLLKPTRLNKKELGEAVYYDPEIKYEELIEDVYNLGFKNNTLAMYPNRNSTRIVSQQGMFTLQGKAGIPLDEEHNGDLFNDGIIKRIDLGPSLRKDIENYLKLCGISSFSLFPDLDGLANHINSLGYFKTRELENQETQIILSSQASV